MNTTNEMLEIIGKARESIIRDTNIETSEDEMKVLDSFLFRCWQMGWLDRYEEKKVVYCKDCKYNVSNMEKDPLDATDYTDIVCTYFMTDGMEPHDFCSKGEPNESNTTD